MSTKEQVLAAARSAVRRKEIKIVEGVTVSLRELLKSERAALQARLFVCGPDGKPTVTRDLETKEDTLTFNPEEAGRHDDRWIEACITPTFTAEELAGDEWPDSIKAMLYREARAINTVSLEDVAKNS